MMSGHVGEQFAFVVRSSFVITGRGTVAVGYVTAGSVAGGAPLEVVRTGKRCVCGGVSWVREVPLRDPASIALHVPELVPADLEAGDELRTVLDDGIAGR